MPALRTGKALRTLPIGTHVLVTCTDPLAAIDIPHLCRQTGHVLESSAQEAGVLTFRIRRCDVASPSP